MQFTQVSNWNIPEGEVIRVTDSLNRVIWEKQQPVPPTPTNEYFYVEDASGTQNTLTIVKNNSTAPSVRVYYSTDKINWVNMGYTSTTAKTATIPANGRVYLKATTGTWGIHNNTDFYVNNIKCDANFNVGGNIMSLLYGDNFENQTVLTENYTFLRLFDTNSYVYNKIVDASNLILPATTLTYGCYYGMFQNCTSLVNTPVLPATTLAQQCYQEMFYSCTTLTTAPALSATTLANGCYFDMFRDCTSLVNVPSILPATTLATECYGDMFHGCSSLTTAPELPATTLVDECYIEMFWECSSLNYIKCLATDIPEFTSTLHWVDGVSSTGTFVKNASMSGWSTGVDGIPNGWTVIDA